MSDQVGMQGFGANAADFDDDVGDGKKKLCLQWTGPRSIIMLSASMR